MSNTLKSCILAARPKTLPAAIVPVWLGCVLAWKLEGVFDAWLAICTLLGAVWIQIATNFFNDAIDNDKGADTEKRLGPVRATSSGLLTRKQVYGAAMACLAIAGVFGWFLFQARGWTMLAIGIPSLYLCYGYTGGPVPLAYRGLGEVFVILFFGVIAVMGTIFVQLGSWPIEGLLLGLQVGLLSAVLISINNLRDREEDEGNKKRTLAVKLGEKWGKRVIYWEILVSFVIISILWWKMEMLNQLMLLWFVYPLYFEIYRRVKKETPSEKYNQYLAFAGIGLIFFAILFTLVCAMSNEHNERNAPQVRKISAWGKSLDVTPCGNAQELGRLKALTDNDRVEVYTAPSELCLSFNANHGVAHRLRGTYPMLVSDAPLELKCCLCEQWDGSMFLIS